MTEHIYKGFGSHIVLDRQIPTLENRNKGNGNEGKWRNLKLQLKYFTLDSPLDVSRQNQYETTKYTDSADQFKTKNDRLLVIDTNSCESFYSCSSNLSNEFSKQSKTSETNNQNRNIKDRSDEVFHDQISIVNAIFLSRKENQDYKLARKVEMNNSEYSSGDGASKFAFPNHESQIGNLRTQQSGKEDGCQQSSSARAVIPKDIHSVSKTFKTNRRIKKTSKSKTRKICQQLFYKVQPLARQDLMSQKDNGIAEQITPDSEATEESHKGTLLQIKHGLSEGYEIQFLKPKQLSNRTITLFSEPESGNETSDVNAITMEKGNSCFHEKPIKGVKSHVNLDNPLLVTSTSQQNLNSSIDKPSDETIVCFTNSNHEMKVYEPGFQNGLRFKLFKDQRSTSDKKTKEENITNLQESKTQIHVSQKEILLKNDELLRRSGNKSHKPILQKVLEVTKTSNPHKDEPKSVGHTKIEHYNSIRSSNARNTSLKSTRRRSSSRKSSLPVIEESPEQETSDPEILDYYLVDSLGRPIHLFDSRGRPLTDGSGRPLRNAAGELLMKCSNNGIPLVDEDTRLYDVFGNQPHDEEFQPWKSPNNSEPSRLTMGDGCPLVLFDLEGRPLTSVSGTMLVDRNGRTLLKLRNCIFQSDLS